MVAVVGSTSLTIEDIERAQMLIDGIDDSIGRIYEFILHPDTMAKMLNAFTHTGIRVPGPFGIKLRESEHVPQNKVLVSDGYKITGVIEL